MNALPDVRSAKDHGPFSGYCHVCWNAVYVLWISDEPPGGVCQFGYKRADECPDAMGRARTSAAIKAMKRNDR